MDVVNRVKSDGTDCEKVLEDLGKAFNDQGISDYIVVYLRLITSGKV